MGYAVHQMRVESVDRTRSGTVDALVDTGAMLPMIPARILRELGIEPTTQVTVILGDGSEQEFERGGAYISIDVNGDGDGDLMPLLFGPDDQEAIIGVVPLEIFGLVVDPVDGRIVSRRHLRV